jgi:8-oxo-dGTP pyrophosphatase MutT (NUDIX family)
MIHSIFYASDSRTSGSDAQAGRNGDDIQEDSEGGFRAPVGRGVGAGISTRPDASDSRDEGAVPPIVRLAAVLGDEVASLSRKYGAPERLLYSIQADDYIYSYRWGKDSDRRAEVVFAIQDPSGNIWVHAKSHYPAHIYRLPSGGVHWDEDIETALLREVQEETGLPVRVERFLGLLEYTFYYAGSTAEFASYVFYLRSGGGKPIAEAGESICEFRPIPPTGLSEIAVDLRNLIGDRRGWGQWRALAHDLVYERLRDEGC